MTEYNLGLCLPLSFHSKQAISLIGGGRMVSGFIAGLASTLLLALTLTSASFAEFKALFSTTPVSTEVLLEGKPLAVFIAAIGAVTIFRLVSGAVEIGNDKGRDSGSEGGSTTLGSVIVLAVSVVRTDGFTISLLLIFSVTEIEP